MWELLFFFSAVIIFYSYLGYPAALYVIGKFKRKKAAEPRVDYLPRVCLFISAFNEEKIIRRKIENSLNLNYPKERLRILIASDGSTDRTVEIGRDYGDLGVEVYHHSQRRGKSAVINSVIPELTEEIVVFTDANCLFAEDALSKLIAHLSDPQIGCVVGKLNYTERHLTSVGKGEGIYWKFESKIRLLESALKSVLVANGAIFAIRRELFRPLYPHVANDFQIPVEIGSRGYGVVYEPEAVAVERSPIFWQEEFQRKVRIVLRGITGFVVLRSKFRGFRLWQFFSHKLMRWMVTPFLFLSLLSNAMLLGEAWIYQVSFAFQVLFYFAAINGWRVRRTSRPRGIFYIPFYFTMVNFAAIVAIAKFLSGRRQIVWEKAESARFSPAPATGNGSVSEKHAEAEEIRRQRNRSASRSQSGIAQSKR